MPVRLLQQLVRGVIGVSKAKLGIGRVPVEVMKQRLQTCVACPQLTENVFPGCGRRCGVCGCGVFCKAQLAAERCPEGRW